MRSRAAARAQPGPLGAPRGPASAGEVAGGRGPRPDTHPTRAPVAENQRSPAVAAAASRTTARGRPPAPPRAALRRPQPGLRSPARPGPPRDGAWRDARVGGARSPTGNSSARLGAWRNPGSGVGRGRERARGRCGGTRPPLPPLPPPQPVKRWSFLLAG